MYTGKQKARGQAGFSLIELLIAMVVMMVITAAASTLLVGSFNIRSREDHRSDALADARRAMNILTRELANSGYKLPRNLTYTNSAGVVVAVPRNGLLPADCDGQSVAFVANLNAMDNATIGSIDDPDEAIKYLMINDAAGNSYLVRRELRAGGKTEVLANRVDGLAVQYLNSAGIDTAANLTQAATVRVRVWVNLRASGTPGSPGYQPPRQAVLDSAVALRNSNPNFTY